ncbi:MAG: TetR/AcrR family transcriptional regulator [Steroidobacteraceae bacterium]
MARPRQFNEEAVRDSAVRCFWSRGFGATSIKDLIEETGITAASLYNAFGDKRALFRMALDHYVERGIGERIRRLESLPPREAIGAFFEDVVRRSLSDPERKGCMVVNSALELAPHDLEFREIVSGVLGRIEAFLLECIKAGQADGTITRSVPARDLAHHLFALLIGVRVLARLRPEKALLDGAIRPALALLDGAHGPVGKTGAPETTRRSRRSRR